MAGLFERQGRWFVTVALGKVDGKHQRRRREFSTRAEAEQYMSDNGLVHTTGRRFPRSRDQVIADIAESSALTDSGCVVWLRRLTKEGYGSLSWKPEGKTIGGAHRVAYHVLVAEVSDGLVVDHLCRNRACVRPDHLELVKRRENVMRSPIAPGALNAAKTHCAQGHAYTPENTYRYTPKTRSTTARICRTCQRAYYLRRKASA